MIAIRVVSRAGEAVAGSLAARFDEPGGDIGRAADCTLVLPDPERRISRKHVQVACRGGRHSIRMISTNLMVELDGVPLAPGVEYPLEVGAQIRIGPFALLAESGEQPGAAAADFGVANDDSLALLGPGHAARPSVFHDLLHPAASEPAAPAVTPYELDLEVGDPTGAGLRPAASADAVHELVAALYAGLGLPGREPARPSAPQMQLIGALLRAAVEGTLGLLASRTIAKRELGATRTVPRSRANNPLKFAIDADTALAQLLKPPQRGFIAPTAAVRDAFDDIRAHEIAVLAGMRAALEAVLARFNPETLESRLAAKGMWDNLVPVNHKARLWERYTEQHAEIMQEIEDDFDSLFGRAFLDAYEEQLVRLASSAAPDPPS